jgi:lipid-binding SYLF domain-containing protein
MNLKNRLASLTLGVLCLLLLVACQSTGKDGKPLTQSEIIQKREATIKMAQNGFNLLVKQDPKVRKEIESAAGYAVFNTTNVNVILVVVARGEGLLYDKRYKEQPIFMRDMKTGEGLGAGYQEQYQIIIFKTVDAIDQFLLTTINGQQVGLDVEANFSAGSSSTIRSFNPNVTFYSVGISGYDLQANYGGALYMVDHQLNTPAVLKALEAKEEKK